MSSPYSLHGADLINKGYCAIPCHPGAKYPGHFFGGQWMKMTGWTTKYASSLPSRMDVAGWSRAEGAGICLVLGRASRGVVAIDVDVDEAVNAVRLSFDATPVAKRGKKGCTFFFRGDVKSTAFNRENADGTRERLVDVLAEGRQTVLPPTVHPETGQPYEWIGSPLWEVDINDLPELPADALEMLEQALARYGYNPNKLRHTAATQELRPARERTDEGDGSFAGLNQFAMENFGLWVPKLGLQKLAPTAGGYEAVADWRSSCTNRPLAQRKQNLKIHREGIKDFGDDKTYSPIDLVMASLNMGDCCQAFEWLADVTGWRVDLNNVISPNFEANMKRKQAERAALSADLEDEPQNDDKPQPSVAEIPPWRMSSVAAPSVTQCPGFVGRVADWIVQTARVQQPEFAMAAALVLTATLAGRRTVGPTGTGLQLFAIIAGGTGAGKDHPIEAIDAITNAAGFFGRMRLGGGFTSGAAILSALWRNPLAYSFMDEAGKTLFAKGKGKNAASHEQQIHAYLRSLFTSKPSKPTMGEERAAGSATTVHGACLSLLCATTPTELFASCDSMDVMNGFLNRFLVFTENPEAMPIKNPLDISAVPDDIVEQAKAIYYHPDDRTSALFHGGGDVPIGMTPFTVPWDSEAVGDAWFATSLELRAKANGGEKDAEIYPRAAEYMVRVATIRAIGINHRNPAITMEDFLWAKELVLRSFEKFAKSTNEHMVENDFERDRNRVLKYIKRRKAITKRDIQRGMTGIRSKYLDELLERLKSEEVVEEVDVTDPEKDSRKRTAYRAVA